MDKLIEFLKGKKTYIVAITTVVLGLLQGLGIFTMPEYIWPVLAGAFGISLRAGVNKVAETVETDD